MLPADNVEPLACTVINPPNNARFFWARTTIYPTNAGIFFILPNMYVQNPYSWNLSMVSYLPFR